MTAKAVISAAETTRPPMVRVDGQPPVRVPPSATTSDPGHPESRGGAGPVELGKARVLGAMVGQDPVCHGEGNSADGDVDPADRRPAGPGRQRTADQDTAGNSEAPDGAPQRVAPAAGEPAMRR